jgi:hypothetical protein
MFSVGAQRSDTRPARLEGAQLVYHPATLNHTLCAHEHLPHERGGE